jgi:hypothetical protein
MPIYFRHRLSNYLSGFFHMQLESCKRKIRILFEMCRKFMNEKENQKKYLNENTYMYTKYIYQKFIYIYIYIYFNLATVTSCNALDTAR